MRVQLRETGSILVRAERDDVLHVLEAYESRAARVGPDRVEGEGSTYVVQEAPGGTRVFHMRSEDAPVTLAAREREALRRAVQADLFQLLRLFDARSR